MLNYLDLLVIVSMALVAASLLALCLMFLVKHKRVKQVCLYIVTALGLYAAYVGLQIGWPYFMGQAVAALILGAVSLGAVVLERLSKGDDKKLLIARLMAAGGLILGIVNALFL